MRKYEKSVEDDRTARERSYQKQNIFLVITGLILSTGQIIAAIILSYRESLTDQILRHILGRKHRHG